jgi:hypothetical protein
MQTFCLHSGWKRWTPMMVTVLGGVALLSWHLEAQTLTEGKPQMPAQSGEPEQKSGYYRSIKVGDYTLKIADSAKIYASYASLLAGKENFRFASDMLGSSARMIEMVTGQNFPSNLSLRLDFEGPNPEDTMLIQGLEHIRSVDDRGRAVRTPAIASPAEWLRSRTGKGTQKREVIGLQKEQDAKSLQTLEGELVVINGAVRTFTFAEDELHRGALKSFGHVHATFDSMQRTHDGYEVSFTCISRRFDSPQSTNILAETSPWLWDARTPQAECIGTDGVRYKSTGLGMSTRDPFHPQGQGNHDAVGGLKTTTSEATFHFPLMPEGVRPRSITVRFVEQQGENFRVPVKFTDIPLAEPSH